MANYTLTSSSVLHSTSAAYANYTAGETIAAGQPVYADSTALDDFGKAKVKLADANASAATASVIGIAANTASSGQPVRVVSIDSDFTHGLATVAAGDIIIVSATAGGLAPASDMASGMYPAIVMLAKSATKAIVSVQYGTAAKP
jgi:hypothetical protein